MSESREQIRAREERDYTRVISIAVLLMATGILAMLGIRVMRDPIRRKRVFRKIEKTWTGVEDAAERTQRRFARKRARIEAETRRIAEGFWELVDDLPFVSSFGPFPEVPNRYYGHGAFMGAAPALLADPQWRRILAFLMPDVYRDVRDAVSSGVPVGALIPMFENNPVMCAFGVVQLRQIAATTELPGMEWDVFVDGELVDLFAETPEANRQPIIERLVSTLVIAHASTTDTLQEQIGLCQFRDVRRTPKAHLGGVEPAAWMDLFGRALRLFQAPNLSEAIRIMSADARADTFEECRKYTFAQPISIGEAVAEYTAITGRPRFSIVLEIKSLRSTPALIHAMVGELNRRGLHVAAVGSFLLAEIQGTAALRQVVGDAVLPGPREILFLHFAGELQAACERGLLPRGQSVMFNGASLIEIKTKNKQFTYSIRAEVIREIAHYREKFDLHIGLYVQENDTDADAATLLSKLVHEYPEVFTLGFAWGGLADQAPIQTGVGDHRGFGSQKYLDRLGYTKLWVPGRNKGMVAVK